MSALVDQPLSQIVSDNFQTAHVFEKYGFNFCCKGKQTLQDACRNKGIEINQILDELNIQTSERGGGLDFAHLRLTELCDYIVSVHHTYVRQSIPLILDQVLKVVTQHGDRFPQMKKVYVLFNQISTELYFNMKKEEEILFPAIRQMEERMEENSTLTNTIETTILLEAEHQWVGSLIQQIRKLTSDFQVPEKVCTTFRVAMNALHHFETDLHKHVHLENNILFPHANAASASN